MRVLLAYNDEEIINSWKNNRPIITSITIKINSNYFPSEDWDDFSVVILNWWLENIIAHCEGQLLSDNNFMDGPFLFRTRVDGDWIEISFYEDETLEGDEKLVKYFETRLSFKAYAQVVINAAKSLLDKLKTIGVDDDDINILNETLNKAVETVYV